MNALEKLTHYFLPKHLRNNPLHPEYEGVYGLVNGVLWAAICLWVIFFVLYAFGYSLLFLFLNGISILVVLPFVRRRNTA